MTAEQIIKGFMNEKRVARADLCHSQMDRHIRLRRAVIERMRREGFSIAEMARAMGKNLYAIKYWTSGDWEETEKWKAIARASFRATESDSIVIQVCNEHKIYPAEIFGGGRDKRLTDVRREAMRRLSAAGFNMAAIARALRLNYDTVRYWMNDGYREYSRRVARACLARSQKAELRA